MGPALARPRTTGKESRRHSRGAARPRPGMAFLIANMPDADLHSLKADFLLTNTDLAYRAHKRVPWGKDVPEGCPRRRAPLRQRGREARRLAQGALRSLSAAREGLQAPAEAAQKLDGVLFQKLKLGYSTRRRREPEPEGIDRAGQGLLHRPFHRPGRCLPARVCVPARLVGTPLSADQRSNRTWVEIWDKTWRFTGGCEPDPKGLDRGWFVGDAAQAHKDVAEQPSTRRASEESAAALPARLGTAERWVPAENMTDRYAKSAGTKPDTGRSAEA